MEYNGSILNGGKYSYIYVHIENKSSKELFFALYLRYITLSCKENYIKYTTFNFL